MLSRTQVHALLDAQSVVRGQQEAAVNTNGKGGSAIIRMASSAWGPGADNVELVLAVTALNEGNEYGFSVRCARSGAELEALSPPSPDFMIDAPGVYGLPLDLAHLDLSDAVPGQWAAGVVAVYHHVTGTSEPLLKYHCWLTPQGR